MYIKNSLKSTKDCGNKAHAHKVDKIFVNTGNIFIERQTEQNRIDAQHGE